MLIVDSREKWTQNSAPSLIRSYLKRHNIPYVVRALDCGDYMMSDGDISVDRKKTLDELAKNLLNPHDKARFYRELRRAKEHGIRLIILCEHGAGVKSVSDVIRWRSRYGRVTGKALARAITKAELSYGIRFVFCDKRSTARLIISLLEGRDEVQSLCTENKR